MPGKLDPRSAVDLTKRLNSDGTFDWEVPPGQWQVFVFFQQPINTRVIGGVGVGPQLVMDHMNKAALEAHFNQLGQAADAELGPFYGNALRAGFCDSLEVDAEDPWTDNFIGEFQKPRGYDLKPWLPFIDTPGRGNPYGAYESMPFYDGPGADRVRREAVK